MAFKLEAVTSTKGNATIGEALVTQQSALIDTVLSYVFLSEVNRLNPNVQIIVHIVVNAGIELPSVVVDDRDCGPVVRVRRPVML